ncbi:MAG: DNA primase, partial [Muribaculaceae bacterium]|nr:DNA primase [Muribaculaceae bacterium]
MIDRETAQKIKDTASIVDIVRNYTSLKRSGSNYVALCPFHNERTPSFHINTAKNFCYCFSCHKGGSPVNFLMEKENISYPEALRKLAEIYHIRIEEKELTDEERLKQSEREALQVANEWAMQYFESNLHDTEEGQNIGLSYLYERRKITYEAVRAFHLGYCLEDGKELEKAAKAKGIRKDILLQLGILKKSEKGFVYAFYYGRVIFPIQNVSGKVVGFGARSLSSKANAKYFNSPESDIFKKNSELYGLYQAKDRINTMDECILVEGYFDVIGFWQSGVKNVVASCGTALTKNQIAIIKRFTNNVTIIYDSDAAGIKATQAAAKLALLAGMDVNVLLLPEGDDPDSFSQNHSTEEIEEYIRTNKTDIIRYIINLNSSGAPMTSQNRYSLVTEVVEYIACIPHRMKRLIYTQDCSRLLGVGEEDLLAEVEKKRRLIEREEWDEAKRRELYSKNNIESSANPTINSAPAQTSDITSSSAPLSVVDFIKKAQTNYPLLPMEWKVLQYCIRYGFSTFCMEEIETENGIEKRALNVVDYVDEELAADSAGFSVPEFSYIFQLIRNLQPDFQNSFQRFCEELALKKSEKREEGYQNIGETYSTVTEIERAEQKLEESLDEWEAVQMQEFAKSYLATQIPSQEEELVRSFSTEALLEKYQFSNIYSRERQSETEEDR